MLDRQKAVLQSSLPLFREHGETIAGLLYQELLFAHPQYLSMFSWEGQVSGKQACKFASALLHYAEQIEDPDPLLRALHTAHYHHARNRISAPDYDALAVFLLDAFRTVLGPRATDAVLDAWAAAYRELAAKMMDAAYDPPPLPASAPAPAATPFPECEFPD